MPRSLVQVSLFAMTLGLAALGSTLTPAAALPSMHPGNVRLPSLPAAHPVYATPHQSRFSVPPPPPPQHNVPRRPPNTTIHLPQIAKSNLPRPIPDSN